MMRAYFDYQSGTPILPEVWEAMRPYWTEVYASPVAMHQLGLRARDALARAREQVAAMINAASPEEIIFTSGGTESANLAVKGAAYASQRRGRHIVLTMIEHPAVMKSVEFLESQGFTCTRVPVDQEGRVAPSAIEAALQDDTILVCVHHVNHDLGTIEPLPEICGIASERGVPVFADAVASGGWLPIDVQAWGVQMLSLSPHRFYGPKGVGVLYRNRRARLDGIQHGGVQEQGRRAGTENVPAIVGAGMAAELARHQLPGRIMRTVELQKRLWAGLKAVVPCVCLNGPKPGDGRITTNLNVSVEFVEGEGLVLMADVQGIALASGASCVSKSIQVSPVLEAIGLNRSLAQANVLLTLTSSNTIEEVDYFLGKFPGIVSKLRSMSPTWEDFESGNIQSIIPS